MKEVQTKVEQVAVSLGTLEASTKDMPETKGYRKDRC